MQLIKHKQYRVLLLISIVFTLVMAFTMTIQQTAKAAPGWTSKGLRVAAEGGQVAAFGIGTSPAGETVICAGQNGWYHPAEPSLKAATVYNYRETDTFDFYKVTSLNPLIGADDSVKITSKAASAQLSYISNKHLMTSNMSNVEASALAVTPNIVFGQSDIYDQALKNPSKYWPYDTNDWVKAVNIAKTWWEDAKKYAPPYTVDKLKLTLDNDQATGSFSNIYVTSSANNKTPDVPVTITLTGNAVWEKTGNKTLTLTTDGTNQTAKFKVTGPGNISAKAVYNNIPREKAWVASTKVVNKRGLDRKGQDIIISGKLTEISAVSDNANVEPMQPVLTSHVTHKVLDDATKALQDNITLKLKTGKWLNRNGKPVPVVVDVNLYGPFSKPSPESANPPADVKPLKSFKLTYTKEETLPTPETIVKDTGYYTFVANINKSSQDPAYREFINDHKSPFMEEPETSVKPTTPSVTSLLSFKREGNEIMLNDKLDQTGFPNDHSTLDKDEKVIEHTLYYINASDDIAHKADKQVPDKAVKITSVTTPAKNGKYDISDKTLKIDTKKQNGRYFIVSSYKGDERTKAFTTSWTDMKESYVIEWGNVSTKLGSTHEPIQKGDSIWDNVNLSGNLPPGSKTEIKLYGNKGLELKCTDETIIDKDLLKHDGVKGQYKTKDFKIDAKPGHVYGYVETTTYPDGTVFSKSKCSEPSETIALPEELTPNLPNTGANTRVLLYGVGALMLTGGAVLALTRYRKTR